MNDYTTLHLSRKDLALLVTVLERDVQRDQERTGVLATDLSCVHETKFAYERACILDDLTDRLAEDAG